MRVTLTDKGKAGGKQRDPSRSALRNRSRWLEGQGGPYSRVARMFVTLNQYSTC